MSNNLNDVSVLGDFEPSPDTKLPPPLKLDPEKYRHHFDGEDISIEQQNEMMQALWAIVSSIVDCGFGLNSAQMFLDGFQSNLCRTINEHAITDSKPVSLESKSNRNKKGGPSS